MRTAQAGFKRGRGAEGPSDLLVKLGPTLLVDVGHRSRAAPDAPPNLVAKGVRALLDTGAGMDGIDETLARDLKLPVSDEMEISGIGGRHRTLVYLARLYIPRLERLLFQPLAGVKLEEGGQWHRIILCGKFLRGYRTLYDGTTGAVSLSEAGDGNASLQDRFGAGWNEGLLSGVSCHRISQSTLTERSAQSSL